MLQGIMSACRIGLVQAIPRQTAAIAGCSIASVRFFSAAAVPVDRPKRPATSFSLFVKERRAAYVAKNPNKTPQDVLKGMGRAWKALPDTEKIVYTQEFEKLEEKYRQAMAEYMKNRSEADIKRDRAEKKAQRAKKDPNAPKRAKSAYIFFSMKVREALDRTMPVTEQSKIIASRWHNMSDDDKKKYEKLAAEDKKRYEREMAAYNKK